MKRRRWKMPAWMRPYAAMIGNTGGNPIEELMNDHDCNVVINAPRAMLCVAVESQVALLMRLHTRGLLDQRAALRAAEETAS